jgi:hypothetical protein
MHCPLYNIHRQQLVDSFNELNVEFTIQTILYGSEISDYNQNVKLFRAVHSFIKRSKRFDNNIVIYIYIFLYILNYNSILTYGGP